MTRRFSTRSPRFPAGLSAPATVVLSAAVVLLAGTVHRAHARSRTGHIKVECGTRGARIFIDGQEMGLAPVKDPIPVSAGPHVVKVSKAGHADYLEVIPVRPGQVRTVEVDLFPIKGVLRVSADAKNARVYVDGKYMGRVPVDLEMSPGAHSVRVALSGYQDVLRRYTAKAGRVARLRAKMVPLAASVGKPAPVSTDHKKWYQKWWFWTSVAGGVVAVGLAVLLPLALYKDDPTRTFDPNRVLSGR